MGFLAQPVPLDDIVEENVRLVPASGMAPQAELAHAMRGEVDWDPHVSEVEMLMRWVASQQSARGSEVRHLHGAPHARGRWHEFPTEWLQWEELISVPWRHRMSSIGLGEANARLLAIRHRARQPELHGQRFLHLLDSQTNLGCIARGRTASVMLLHVHLQTSAYILAAGLREFASYCRSDKNPADASSRDTVRWRRVRNQRKKKGNAQLAARLPASDLTGSERQP